MIGDLQQHGGFVYGDAYPDWRGFDYAQEQVTVAVDGVLRVAKGVNAAGPDLLQLVVWLANQPRTRGLRKGQWITTGSWTGKTLAQAGSSAHVHFTHFGEVRLQFE
jgi:2-keto-4-pentenoate hydratase